MRMLCSCTSASGAVPRWTPQTLAQCRSLAWAAGQVHLWCRQKLQALCLHLVRAVTLLVSLAARRLAAPTALLAQQCSRRRETAMGPPRQLKMALAQVLVLRAMVPGLQGQRKVMQCRRLWVGWR